eukprot:10587258-Alexandrium_andersonii.AAC.1
MGVLNSALGASRPDARAASEAGMLGGVEACAAATDEPARVECRRWGGAPRARNTTPRRRIVHGLTREEGRVADG